MAERLEIDRIRCDGHGVCAELLPELLELDDWGYPIVRGADVPRALLDHARRAVEGCPVLALKLVRRDQRLDSDRIRPPVGAGRA